MALRVSTALRNALLGAGTGDNGSFKDIMADGVLEIYSGSQPANADAAEAGTKLLRITESGGAFTPGSATNGLEFGDSSGGSIAKASGETWQGDGITGGTAGWFRFYDNDYDTGSGTDKIRFDGAVATAGAELNLSSTTIVQSATTTIDAFTISMPAS
jgi:hypothetical protein